MVLQNPGYFTLTLDTSEELNLVKLNAKHLENEFFFILVKSSQTQIPHTFLKM